MSVSHRLAADHHIGVFASCAAAEAAVRALINAGYCADEIGLFVQAPPHRAATTTRDGQIEDAIEEGGEIGAALGATAGGLGGILAGMGLLAIPGVGPILAIGPVAGALTGAVTGGAVGGFTGSLAGLGISEAQAAAAERHLKTGRTLVLVQSAGRGEETAAILTHTGAIDISDKVPGPSHD